MDRITAPRTERTTVRRTTITAPRGSTMHRTLFIQRGLWRIRRYLFIADTGTSTTTMTASVAW